MRAAGAWKVGVLALAVGVAGGCASQSRVTTPAYALTLPSYWKVTQTAKGPGEATKVVVVPYGDAVIDQGPGAQAPYGANYDALLGDVHVWIYTWPKPSGGGGPAEQVFQKLGPLEELALTAHGRVPDQPIECNRFPRGYSVAGQEVPAVDLLKRPGWRTVLLGAHVKDVLLGVVARVEFEQDVARYCQNLRNLQVQLQNLLDGLVLAGLPPAGVTDL